MTTGPRSRHRRGHRPRSRAAATTLAWAVAAALLLGPGSAVADPGDPSPPRPGASTGWVRPVPGPVVQPFDPPAEEWSAGHRGVDLAAGAGTAVRAPAHGSVTFAGTVAGKPVVVVAHDDGLRSTFEPAVAVVPRGTSAAAGDVVAQVEPTGTGGHCAPAGCLHWGVLRGETYLDPLLLLGEDVPIVLLPTGG